MVRRLLSLVAIASAIALSPQAGLKTRLYVPLSASTSAQSASADKQASATLRSTDLAGLRLRGIGPATMSGRFVDMDVVESNPYIMYVASATGGMYRTHRQRRDVGAGVRARSGALHRRRRDLSARSQHHLGRHRRARQPAERELGRRHLQDHRCRQDVDQRRPQDLDAHRPHRHSPVEPRHRVCGRAGIGVGTWRRTRPLSHRWTAARRGSARCTWTTTPA